MIDSSTAAIVASLVAFLGVLVTLQVNQHHFEISQREERDKVRQEKEFSAKHQAFLAAAESVIRFVNYYLTIPDRDLPKPDEMPDHFNTMAVNINCLHFYCNLETIKQAVALSQVFQGAYTDVLRAKIPSVFVGLDIKNKEQEIEHLEKFNGQLQQEIIAISSTNSSHPILVSHRQRLSENYRKIGELHDQKADLLKTKYKTTEACRDVMMGHLKEVHQALRNILLMARRELSFSIDDSEYTNILNKTTEEAIAKMQSLVEEIRAGINKKMEGLERAEP